MRPHSQLSPSVVRRSSAVRFYRQCGHFQTDIIGRRSGTRAGCRQPCRCGGKRCAFIGSGQTVQCPHRVPHEPGRAGLPPVDLAGEHAQLRLVEPAQVHGGPKGLGAGRIGLAHPRNHPLQDGQDQIVKVPVVLAALNRGWLRLSDDMDISHDRSDWLPDSVAPEFKALRSELPVAGAPSPGVGPAGDPFRRLIACTSRALTRSPRLNRGVSRGCAAASDGNAGGGVLSGALAASGGGSVSSRPPMPPVTHSRRRLCRSRVSFRS